MLSGDIWILGSVVMLTRQLGSSGLGFTTIGLGTWAIGGPWQYGWGSQNDDDAISAIVTALDQGVNWIDTAPIYGHGHSEALVCKALKKTDKKPFIATKCGLVWDEEQERIPRLKAKSIRQECHASLKRLGIDVIDLYQMHWCHPDEDIEEAWEEMVRLIEQGKVRHIGVSNFSVSQIKRVQKIHPVASLQPPYSMLHRDVEDELLGYCAKNNIGVIVYSPMQRGLLTDKFSQKRLASLAADDHRRKNIDFQEPQFSVTLELVEQLKPIAERYGRTCAQLAISWTLRRSEVTSAIVGARKPNQIIETAAADFELSDEDIQEIEQLLADCLEKINTKK